MNWYLAVLKNYVGFGGRARRQEYWMFFLFSMIAYVVLFVVDLAIHSQLLVGLYGLAVLLPSLAVTIRRLHDTGRSGWWLLIGIVPLVGGLILLVFSCLDSEAGENQYGPNPKAVAAV